jgi:hypothetical protein
VDDALEQHIDIVIEVVNAPASEIADVKKPGIVDEAIGWPECGLSLFHRRPEASKVGNVRLDEAIRCIPQAIDRRFMTRDQEKRMALARKGMGQCPPDPVACAGNDDERRRYDRSPRLNSYDFPAGDSRACRAPMMTRNGQLL